MVAPSFQRSSIPFGSCCGIPVRLHVLFPLVLVIQVLFKITDGFASIAYWLILLGPFLVVTVLLHELGHSLAARAFGTEAHGIMLWPLGGLAFIGRTSTIKNDLLMALAGPLTHIPQILVWLLVLWLSTGSTSLAPRSVQNDFWAALVVYFIIVNISLLIFNLCVPAYPLDGGRILADSLLLCGIVEETAAKVIVVISALMGIAIAVWGFVAWLPITVLIGFWILYAAFGLILAIKNDTVREHELFRFDNEKEEALFSDRT